MADKYIERRMEAYRSGRLARQSRSTPGMRRVARPDTLSLTYPEMAVALLGADLTPLLRETVTAFRSVGAKVAFTCTDTSNEAVRLSQHTGSRYYPASSSLSDETIATDLTDRWGKLDIVIDLRGKNATWRRADLPSHTVNIPPSAEPSAAARLIVFLAHPSNATLINP